MAFLVEDHYHIKGDRQGAKMMEGKYPGGWKKAGVRVLQRDGWVPHLLTIAVGKTGGSVFRLS